MAIPFLQRRAERLCLVLARIPEHLEILLCTVTFRVERRVHLVYNLFIRTTLEGNRLTLVIETEV